MKSLKNLKSLRSLKKVGAMLAILALSVTCLAGCGGGNKPADKAAAGGKDKEISLTLSVPDPETSSIGKSAAEYAKRVQDASKGSLKVKVYYNGSLYGGDSAAGIKQLSAGGLDILILSSSLYASFNPGFNVISVPYMFDDTKQFTDYLNSETGTKLMASVDKVNIKTLGTWTRSFRQVTNSKKPINVPQDLTGIKLRVPNNPLWVEYFAKTGASCTPMSFSEVYNALQLDTLDGQENPVDVPLSAKFYEVQKYISMTNHMADAWLVGMNKAKFAALSDAQKKVLTDAATDMQKWKVDYDKTADQKALDELKSKGMTVNEISKENHAKFVELSKSLYGTFKGLVKDDALFDATTKFVHKS